LRTEESLSEAVRSEQVLASIIMFGLVYVLLFVLWLVLLNHKIQEGPDYEPPPDTTRGDALLEAAAQRVGHTGSMTEAKEG